MIVYDFEVMKHDWLVCYLDTKTRKMHSIINDANAFSDFYNSYKNEIWVGYNSRNYDVWIAKAILCGFNPYLMSNWLIEQDRKGFEFSRLLNNFRVLNYDCSLPFKSLKELEAYMGHNIKEFHLPFDLDRKLTDEELIELESYCRHDVMETFEVFVETSQEFESHIQLIKEFNLDISNISKTKAQISASILGAYKIKRNDEFDIKIVDTLQLSKYSFVKQWYEDWGTHVKDYKTKLETVVGGVKHTFAFGGLHGALENYIGDGLFVMADVASYYPALMIEYDFLSRNVSNPKKYRAIRDERIIMKMKKDPRQQPRKIVLNSTFGAQKDQYNNLYDPQNANNICINGQLLLLDLIEKLELAGIGILIQSNTDGVLYKLNNEAEYVKFVSIANEWSKRTRMELEFDKCRLVVQKDVNNYLMVDDKGDVKRKGAFVKKLGRLDNDLPIVNEALTEYFINGTPVETTINNSTRLIDFQKITKVGGKYDFAFIENSSYDHVYDEVVGRELTTRVNRTFASTRSCDGKLYKKHKSKNSLDKVASTPDKCFIMNDNIENEVTPSHLDRQWYIDLAKYRIDLYLKG